MVHIYPLESYHTYSICMIVIRPTPIIGSAAVTVAVCYIFREVTPYPIARVGAASEIATPISHHILNNRKLEKKSENSLLGKSGRFRGREHGKWIF